MSYIHWLHVSEGKWAFYIAKVKVQVNLFWLAILLEDGQEHRHRDASSKSGQKGPFLGPVSPLDTTISLPAKQGLDLLSHARTGSQNSQSSYDTVPAYKPHGDSPSQSVCSHEVCHILALLLPANLNAISRVCIQMYHTKFDAMCNKKSHCFIRHVAVRQTPNPLESDQGSKMPNTFGPYFYMLTVNGILSMCKV